MDKLSYIEQERLNTVQSWGSLVFLTGAIVTLLLSLLDYFVTPENFPKFFIYRLITSVLILILFFALRLKKEKTYQTFIIIVASIIPTIMIEIMILSFGGHQSIYYVGMIIMIMFILGFLPLFSMKTSFYLAFQTYAIYILPILFFDNITNIRIFINNNIFLYLLYQLGLYGDIIMIIYS